MPWRTKQAATARGTDIFSATLEQAGVEQEDIYHGPKFLGWTAGSQEDGSSATTSPRGTFADGFNLSSTQSTWTSKEGGAMWTTGLLPRIVPAGVESSNEPRAMWSDAEELCYSSNGFDMKRWRKEHAAELKELKSERRSLQRPRRPRRKAPTGTMASRLSPLPHVPYGKPPPTRDRAAIIELNSHSHDPEEISLILRDDVRFVTVRRELAEAERTQRRRNLRHEVSLESRRRALLWHKRKQEEKKFSKEATEAPEPVPLDEDDDEGSNSKSRRAQNAMARIRCMEDRTAPHDSVTGPLAAPADGAQEQTIGQRIRERIKYVVTCRLQQRRRQARKLANLKEKRSMLVKNMPASQQRVMEFAFEPYQRLNGNSKTIQVPDLQNVLYEAGLGGMQHHEKWSVDRVCKELVFALALEYGSFEKIDAISKFRENKNAPVAPRKSVGRQTVAANESAFLSVVHATKTAALTSSQEDARHSVRMPENWVNLEDGKQAEKCCSSCGNVFMEDSIFCRKCGEKRKTVQLEEVQNSDTREEAGPGSPRALSPRATSQGLRASSCLKVPHHGRPTNRPSGGCANALRSARKFMMSRPLGYEDFCAEVVPAVRSELAELRLDLHFQHFMKVLEGGNDSVNLTHEQFRRLNVRLGIDEDLVQQVMESMSMAQPADGDAVAAENWTPKDPETPDSNLDFDSVHELLMSLEEQNEHRRRRREREIKEKYDLSDAVFWEHRTELIRLYEYFEIYDADHSGLLSHKEVYWLLKHVGFQPYKFHEGRVIQRLLTESDTNRDESMDFVEFLSLMVKVREHQAANREGRLRPIFQKFARESGRLELDDMNKVLEEVGVIGKTRQEQDMIHKLIFEFDTDEKGELGLPDVLALCQKVQEHVLCHTTDSTVRFANSLGIEKPRLAEYLWAFDQYDRDGSAGLGMTEIMEVLRMLMVRAPTNQEVQDLYAEIRVKPSEEVSVHQYLRLMQVASTGRGMFSKELPYTLRGVPPEKLRDVLRIFALADGYVRDLEAMELPELVGSYLGVGPDANLREELSKPVGNARQLLEYAHKVHIAQTQAFMPIGGSISTEKTRGSVVRWTHHKTD